MNSKKAAGVMIAGISIVVLCAGVAVRSATTVKTPPVSAPAAIPAAPRATAADLLSGKVYPVLLKAEQIDSSYYLVSMIDAQGRSSVLATKGDTSGFGGETFLVAYEVPLTSGLAHPPQPKAGTIGQLILINMHALQGLSKITPIFTPEQLDEMEKTPK